MGITREQALKIYWEGEEHVGVLLYGLRRRGEQPHFELDDRLPDGARRSGPWVIRGESWEVDHWTIRVEKLPVGAQWRAWLERVLDDLLQAGYEVSWFALEGDFADPPELFGPARSTSVYAAASRDTGFVCHDAGEGSMRFLTRDDIARLRRPAAAVWADGGVT